MYDRVVVFFLLIICSIEDSAWKRTSGSVRLD
jgi:hypothetical protein